MNRNRSLWIWGAAEARLVEEVDRSAVGRASLDRTARNRDGSRVLEIVRYWSGSREYPCRVTFVISSDGRVTGYKWSGASAGILGNACAVPSAQPAFTVDDMR